MLVSPEENLPITWAEALNWKLLDLQASRGSSKLRLVVRNVTDEELGAATAELSFKKNDACLARIRGCNYNGHAKCQT